LVFELSQFADALEKAKDVEPSIGGGSVRVAAADLKLTNAPEFEEIWSKLDLIPAEAIDGLILIREGMPDLIVRANKLPNDKVWYLNKLNFGEPQRHLALRRSTPALNPTWMALSRDCNLRYADLGNMLMNRFVWLASIAVVIVALFVAYPFLTILRLGSAVRQSDDMGLDAMVDWPQVRDGLKSQFFNATVLAELQKKNSSAAETVGRMLGLTLGSSVADRLLEGMASGKTVVALYKKISEASSIDIRWIREVRFLSPTQFHFALQNPDEKTNPINFVMTLEGIEWKITRVQFSDPTATIANLNSQIETDPAAPASGDGYSKPARESLKKLIDKPAGRVD
jgi:hypothetical protein